MLSASPVDPVLEASQSLLVVTCTNRHDERESSTAVSKHRKASHRRDTEPVRIRDPRARYRRGQSTSERPLPKVIASRTHWDRDAVGRYP